jgi:hypothetical protein
MSDEILKDIKIKVDQISDDMVEVKITQARHEENLKEHMRRTSLLEDTTQNVYEELKPLKIHVGQVEGIAKFIAASATIVSVILGVLKLFHRI